jgi:hypothetical protein
MRTDANSEACAAGDGRDSAGRVRRTAKRPVTERTHAYKRENPPAKKLREFPRGRGAALARETRAHMSTHIGRYEYSHGERTSSARSGEGLMLAGALRWGRECLPARVGRQHLLCLHPRSLEMRGEVIRMAWAPRDCSQRHSTASRSATYDAAQSSTLPLGGGRVSPARPTGARGLDRRRRSCLRMTWESAGALRVLR